MPELPDIEAYLEALRSRVVGRRLLEVRALDPFLLRTFDPPLTAVAGTLVRGVSRLGKRIVIEVASPEGGDNQVATTGGQAQPGRSADGEPHSAATEAADAYYLVIHLMVAGRLHWYEAGQEPARAKPGRRGAGRGGTLAAFEFASGTLTLTEAGSRRRASLHLLQGREALAALDPGGLDVFSATPADFAAALRRENHTLKRALTDPRIFSGVGNAYSDEILHCAGLSPFRLSRSLSDEEVSRLQAATLAVLRDWTDRLVAEARGGFPEKVTAFRPDMAVHGKFGADCPVCGTTVQRIVYADDECDYCPGCQTGGRILADRSLSRLLKDDWPRGTPGPGDED